MKKKIIILSVVFLISVILLVIPSIYLSGSVFVHDINYLSDSVGTMLSMLPFYIIGTVGVVFSVKKLFELF